MPQRETESDDAARASRGDDLDEIDRTAAESFPASDAPAAGGPAADSAVSQGGEQAAGPDSARWQKFLGGVDYPTNKQTLLQAARREGADQNVVQTLQNLPGDQFSSAGDVSEAIGKLS